jgi:hypothetical protein
VKAAVLVTCVVAIVFLIACGIARCADIKLAWNANPPADQVTEYRVWRGIECIGTSAGTQLCVTLPDEPCSLTVTARNAAGESAHSAALDLIPVTVEQSADLKTWTVLRTLHVPRQDKGFFRLKLITDPKS